MARLLILEDRKRDAEQLIDRPPIREYLHNAQATGGPIYVSDLPAVKQAETAKATVVIAQKLEVALELVKQQTFDLVISDLLLFDPAIVNANPGDDYWSYLESNLDLDDRLKQVINPDGLRFIEHLQSATRTNERTPATVPIIAMTFFWRHPRFQALYIDQLTSLKHKAVGYLPKYYWIGNRTILDKEDAALGSLIRLLGTGDDDLNTRLVPLLFDAVALDLFVYQNRFDLHDALENLRTSYDDSCRSCVEFELLFRFGSIRKPTDPTDSFHWVMKELKDNTFGDLAVEIRFHNVPTTTKVVSTGKRKERTLKHPSKGELLAIHSQRENAAELGAKKRKFGICWALALYTYPLAQDPHCLSGEAIAKLLSRELGEIIDKDKVKSDINSLRDDLQGMLPAGIRGFTSAENHLIVTDGKHGYYLNGKYDKHWGT